MPFWVWVLSYFLNASLLGASIYWTFQVSPWFTIIAVIALTGAWESFPPRHE